MKHYFLLLFILIMGCSHPSDDTKMQLYYGTPKLDGVISVNNQTLNNTPLYLLSLCNDQQAITDNTGYFNFTNNCMELIPRVNSNELGYLYKVIIPFNGENLTWSIEGTGYGIKDITALINLTTKTVVYRVDDGINPIHEKVSELTPLLAE